MGADNATVSFGTPLHAGGDCNATLAAFNKAVSELGPLIKAGQVDVTAEEAAAKAGAYSVSAAELSAAPCALHLALAPFDDKGEPAEWQRFSGALPVCLPHPLASLIEIPRL